MEVVGNRVRGQSGVKIFLQFLQKIYYSKIFPGDFSSQPLFSLNISNNFLK